MLDNPRDAFEFACRLAITAPDIEKTEKAIRLAEEISKSLTFDEVETIKRKIEEEA